MQKNTFFEEYRECKTTSISNNLQKSGNFNELISKGTVGKKSIFEQVAVEKKNCSMWELLFDSFWLENYKVSMLFLKVFIFFKLDFGSNTLLKWHGLEICFFWEKKIKH